MTPAPVRPPAPLQEEVHDLNNLVGAILAHAQHIGALAGTAGEIRDSALAIERAADRATELIARIAGTGLAGDAPIDLNSLVEETGLLLHQSGLRIEIELHAGPCMVEGDATLLSQMLLNLGVNARDAMPDGGVLTLQTSVSSGSVLVTVRDTGPGIPAEIHERIFLAGFTTKTDATGAGMGLAIVRHAVDYHGGSIAVESEPGSGAAFHVSLPAKGH